jgi:integral membrane protein
MQSKSKLSDSNFQLLKTPIGRFRIIAFTEGLSFLLILFITMPLKYMLHIPEPNLVIGMVHGVLFLAYVLAVIDLKIRKDWKLGLTFKSLLASVIPFGTFYMDLKYFRKLDHQ